MKVGYQGDPLYAVLAEMLKIKPWPVTGVKDDQYRDVLVYRVCLSRDKHHVFPA
jgi:hypothetical protein